MFVLGKITQFILKAASAHVAYYRLAVLGKLQKKTNGILIKFLQLIVL